MEMHSLVFRELLPICLDHTLAFRIVGNSSLEAAVHTGDLYNDALMFDAKPWKENLAPITDRRHERCRGWHWAG